MRKGERTKTLNICQNKNGSFQSHYILPRKTRYVSRHFCHSYLQELSYRKQIARKLRTQYVEGINRPKYYTVTLKYRLRLLKVTGNGTIGQIIHDLLLVQLFDVKYYRDLEMWLEVTQGH